VKYVVKYARMIYTSAGLVLQIKKWNRRYQLKKIPTSTSGPIQQKYEVRKYVVKYARMIYTSAGLVLQIKK